MHVRNEVILGACLITAEIPSNPIGLRSWCTKCRKQNRGLVIWSVYRRGSTCFSLNSSVHCPHSAIERAKNVKGLIYELHNIAYELRLKPPVTSTVYHSPRNNHPSRTLQYSWKPTNQDFFPITPASAPSAAFLSSSRSSSLM